jgi:hypothetical protein
MGRDYTARRTLTNLADNARASPPMTWHPLEVLRLVFVLLVAALVLAALTTGARPRTAWQWRMVCALIVFLAWALLGVAWLRAAADGA